MLLGGGFVMYRDIGDVKVTVAEVKGSIGALSAKVDGVASRAADAASAQGQALTGIAAIREQLKTAAAPSDERSWARAAPLVRGCS